MNGSLSSSLNVLIVDSDSLTQQGAVHLIRSQRNWSVDTSTYAGLALHLEQHEKPHVALIGVHHLDFVEVRAVNLLNSCNIPILACGSATDVTFIRKVVDLGVDGYIAYNAAAVHLISAVLACAGGRQVVITGNEHQQLFTVVRGTSQSICPRTYVRITNKERTILHAVASGMTNREIAQQLNISLGTVKVHISRLLRKFGLTTRTQLAIDAIRHQHVSVLTTSDIDHQTHQQS